jgi:hypothetical protein
MQSVPAGKLYFRAESKVALSNSGEAGLWWPFHEVTNEFANSSLFQEMTTLVILPNENRFYPIEKTAAHKSTVEVCLIIWRIL